MTHENSVRDCNPSLLEDVLSTAAQLRHRRGDCSDMLIWRRLHGDADMPVPVRMRRRRFWYLSAIVAYERALFERASAKSVEVA